MYVITATVETTHISSTSGEWHGTRHVPTFYLNEEIQGIVSADHAARIAADVIDPLGQIPRERIHVHAVRLLPGNAGTRESLAEALAAADAALGGDSNDAEHDALYSIRETIANLLGVTSPPPSPYGF
jgi:hypothetical protein